MIPARGPQTGFLYNLCYAIFAMLCNGLLCSVLPGPAGDRCPVSGHLSPAVLSYVWLCFAMQCYAKCCHALLCFAVWVGFGGLLCPGLAAGDKAGLGGVWVGLGLDK